MIDISVLSFQTLGYAVLGGFIPPFIWLYFLLKEDERCPEPRTLIAVAFLGGMLAVALVLPIETLVRGYFGATSSSCIEYLPTLCLPILISWAIIEETFKYMVAAFFILWRKEVDEPIDLIVYMLTIALGFAALENTLFLIEPFSNSLFLSGLATNNLRFIGSTLLHVVASTSVGFALAISFRCGRVWRTLFVTAGLILAIALHSLFNFFIISTDGAHTLLAFFVVWTGAVVGFALFEILRYFEYRNLPDDTCYPS
jgi:RsiW-degrading membrane proteinase PrsW (M82 family)